MDRICTFRSEAEQCAKAEYLAISSHFLFSGGSSLKLLCQGNWNFDYSGPSFSFRAM